MSEVTLVKRFAVVATIAWAVLGLAACTKEKPPANVPTPSGDLAQLASPTPTVSTEVPLATPLPTLPLEATPTEAPGGPPVQATAIPTYAAPTGGQSGTYTVQWGDWLNKIAQRYGVTYQALIALNPSIDPNKLYPGQIINVPATGSTNPSTTPESPSPGGTTTYTVQRGDWFYAIARKFGVSVTALQVANPGINWNVVYPGQVLNIPPAGTGAPPPSGSNVPGRYTVQQGDTLYSIAVRFRTTPYALQIANHIANPNFVYPGQVLVVP